jgi:lipopolysaccharide/colanic/teichoic acid biosynthesis glycosyltransferase
MDLCLTVPGLVLTAPVFAAIAIPIKLTDGGPVFFRQERVGLGGRPFRIWKFRTMRANAGGDPITLKDDDRVTPIGRVLRKYRLDEFPQLLNVLTGEMSLVGPRPEVPRYVAHYTPEQRRVLNVPPGITDPAVFKLRKYREQHASETTTDAEHRYLKEIMPEKVRISIEYADQATLWSDCKMLVRTVVGMLAA